MAIWGCTAASRRTIRRTSRDLPERVLRDPADRLWRAGVRLSQGRPEHPELPDCKIIKLYVDDEPFDLTRAELLRFDRVLDLNNGHYRRDVTWIWPSGKRIRLQTTSLVLFVHRHLAVAARRGR